MKAKVIIENGETTILLTPENGFEIDIIEKISCDKKKYIINSDFSVKFQFGTYSHHQIRLSITEDTKPLLAEGLYHK